MGIQLGFFLASSLNFHDKCSVSHIFMNAFTRSNTLVHLGMIPKLMKNIYLDVMKFFMF